MATPETQQPSTIPLSDVTRKATGTAQWLLEDTLVDKNVPILHFNNLSVHICGEDSFKRIAEDIQNAEVSIDIICWGFDPAMELVRKPGPWKRGDTWGDLLRDATEGKLKSKSKRKVQVRVLAWNSPVISAAAGNMPGYMQLATLPMTEKNSSSHEGGKNLPENDSAKVRRPAEVKMQREAFNAHWYRDAVEGRMEGLALRTRGSAHADVVAGLKRKDSQGEVTAGVERLALEYAATHHQKTIVIDYDGSYPRAYVLGLNSVTEYWDTQEHVFNDPRRGENFEGLDTDHSVGKGWEHASSGAPTLKPYQDYACRIEGEAVAAVYKNFVEAWNQARADGKGAGSPISAGIDLKKLPPRLTQNLKNACSRAQIVRTLPDQEGGERSIERLYYQASSFARHYLYIENQYFQNTEWARTLKNQRQKFVQLCTEAGLPKEKIPVLHVMVVIPTPERRQMVPRTHDTVAELGHGDSVPDQDKLIRAELEAHNQYERDMAAYKQRHEANRSDTALDKPFLAVVPPPRKPRSCLCATP